MFIPGGPNDINIVWGGDIIEAFIMEQIEV